MRHGRNSVNVSGVKDVINADLAYVTPFGGVLLRKPDFSVECCREVVYIFVEGPYIFIVRVYIYWRPMYIYMGPVRGIVHP